MTTQDSNPSLEKSSRLAHQALESLRNDQAGSAFQDLVKVLQLAHRLEFLAATGSESADRSRLAHLTCFRQLTDIALRAMHKDDLVSSEQLLERSIELLNTHLLAEKGQHDSGIFDDKFARAVSKVATAIDDIENILDVSGDYDLDEIQKQSLITSQQVLLQSLTSNPKPLDNHALHAQRALKNCAGEVERFIKNAPDYDLEQEHLSALDFALEHLTSRIQAFGSPTPEPVASTPAPLDEQTAAQALEYLRKYRAAPKFSNDHNAIKRTVALEDEIDTFLNKLDNSPSVQAKPRPTPGP